MSSDIDTIIKPAQKLKRPSMYTVVILNDDFTPMDFVVHVLQSVFYLTADVATLLMLKVHQEGRANVGSYTFEVASHKSDLTMGMARQKEHPLQAFPEAI